MGGSFVGTQGAKRFGNYDGIGGYEKNMLQKHLIGLVNQIW